MLWDPVLGEIEPVSAEGLVCPSLVGHEPCLEKESGQETPAGLTAAAGCSLHCKLGGKPWELGKVRTALTTAAAPL